jgi:acylphosphatase
MPRPEKPKPGKAGAPPMRRVHVTFKGRVQGVGFRFTAENVALETGVKGWVRNLPNGDVELMAEGTEDALRLTLERIRASSVGRHIQKAETEWQEFRNEYKDFRVEFVY